MKFNIVKNKVVLATVEAPEEYAALIRYCQQISGNDRPVTFNENGEAIYCSNVVQDVFNNITSYRIIPQAEPTK